MEMAQEPTTQQKPQKKSHTSTIVFIVVIVLLLAVIGWLAWQWKQTADREASASNQTKQLQSQVTDLNKKLQDALKATPTTTTPCVSSVSQNLKDNISAAINSKNTAALEGYMAASVTVVYAASEKGGAEPPAQAVADLDYLNSNATGPWNFNLPDATINTYKAHFYHQYFEGVMYAGKSANNYVVSFGLDCSGKINREFVAASDTLLTTD